MPTRKKLKTKEDKGMGQRDNNESVAGARNSFGMMRKVVIECGEERVDNSQFIFVIIIK